MLSYTVTPKKTALMTARLGAEPAFTVEVPESDDELTSAAGTNADGTPKLTILGLAQEYIANKYQTVYSAMLAEGAKTEKGADGKVSFVPAEQIVEEAELLDIARRAPSEVYRLLVGDRASSTRVSAAAAVAAEQARAREADIATLREAAASVDARPVIIMLARAKGYDELVAELSAL